MTWQQRSPAAVAMGGVGGTHRGAGQLMQPGRAGGVVRVPVRDKDEFHRSGVGQRLKMGFICRTRINHDRAGVALRPQDVGVGSLQAHGSRVGGQDELRQR